MKKTYKPNNFLKAAVALAVAFAFMMPASALIANNETTPSNVSPSSDRYIKVENSIANIGDINHVVQVIGEWNVTTANYNVNFYYDATQIEVVGINIDGTVAQSASWNSYGVGDDTVTPAWYAASAIDFTGVNLLSPSTQPELLMNIVVNIKPGASVGNTLINLTTDGLPPYAPVVAGYDKEGGGPVPTDLIDGNIFISDGSDVWTLTTDVLGNGTVILDPTGGLYIDGTSVEVDAVADEGWEFIGWSGDLSGDTNPETLLMDSDKTVTAEFKQTFDLITNTIGRGIIEIDPTSGPYVDGTTVELTASPDSGWEFIGWSGDLSGDTNPETLLMDADKTVTATFEELPKIPDLDGSGDLSWSDIEPGAEVSGMITIENAGDPESLLDWEIESYPEWGTWTFSPESGTDLAPEDGEFTIDVTVVAPDEQETEFTGTVKLVNSEDSSDYIELDVSLATPMMKNSMISLFTQLLHRICERFPVFELLFGSYFV